MPSSSAVFGYIYIIILNYLGTWSIFREAGGWAGPLCNIFRFIAPSVIILYLKRSIDQFIGCRSRCTTGLRWYIIYTHRNTVISC